MKSGPGKGSAATCPLCKKGQMRESRGMLVCSRCGHVSYKP